MFGSKRIKRVESDDSADIVEEPMEGISLEELGSAYAEAIGTSPEASTTANVKLVSEFDEAPVLAEEQDTHQEELLQPPSKEESDGIPLTPEAILEAMLFLGSSNNQALSIAKLTELFRGITADEVEAMIETLNKKYREHRRVMEIVREQGGYAMQLLPELHLVRDRFYGKIKETHLTQSAIDCLALVAYQPGITRIELEKQWNQPAGSMLGMLVRKGLLRLEKSESRASPSFQYFTTERFLEIIGLESLQDLPHSEEI
jgi:segregation and condensation protein B